MAPLENYVVTVSISDSGIKYLIFPVKVIPGSLIYMKIT